MGKDESGGQVKKLLQRQLSHQIFSSSWWSSSKSAQNDRPNCHERLKLEREGKQKQFQEQETQRKQWWGQWGRDNDDGDYEEEDDEYHDDDRESDKDKVVTMMIMMVTKIEKSRWWL